MKARLALLTAVSALIVAPAILRGQAQNPTDAQHDHNHAEATTPQAQTPVPAPNRMQGMQSNAMGMMNRMKANDAKLDDLVKKMNAATGQAKIDAMAAVLTALVEDRHMAMEPMMSHMMSMMSGGMMNGTNGRSGQTPEK